MKILYPFLFLSLFINCTNQVNDGKKEVLLGVTPEQTLELKGEKIPVQELIPVGMCRLDTFLVVLNVEEDKILRVYHAETFRFLGAFLEKGRGEDEVVSCEEIWTAPWKGKKSLWVKAAQNYIGVLDLEGSLKAGKPCWREQYDFLAQGKTDFLYRPIFALNDSVFWKSQAERPYEVIPNQNVKRNADGSIQILSMQGVERVGAKNLYWLEYNYASATDLDTIWYTDYEDLTDCDRVFLNHEAMSPDRQKLVVAFGNMNQVLLFDMKARTSRWITTEPELPLSNSPEPSFFQYSGVDCTDKRVFAYRAFPEHPHIKSDHSVHIFDWEGTFKFELKLSHPLKYPFLDEEKGYLYATDEEDNICRYNIQAFL